MCLKILYKMLRYSSEYKSLYEDGLPYLETHLDVEGTEDEGGKESVVR